MYWSIVLVTGDWLLRLSGMVVYVKKELKVMYLALAIRWLVLIRKQWQNVIHNGLKTNSIIINLSSLCFLSILSNYTIILLFVVMLLTRTNKVS